MTEAASAIVFEKKAVIAAQLVPAGLKPGAGSQVEKPGFRIGSGMTGW
jgi:hypothetical protein